MASCESKHFFSLAGINRARYVSYNPAAPRRLRRATRRRRARRRGRSTCFHRRYQILLDVVADLNSALEVALSDTRHIHVARFRFVALALTFEHCGGFICCRTWSFVLFSIPAVRLAAACASLLRCPKVGIKGDHHDQNSKPKNIFHDVPCMFVHVLCLCMIQSPAFRNVSVARFQRRDSLRRSFAFSGCDRRAPAKVRRVARHNCVCARA